MTDFKLLSGNANPGLSKRISDYLGVDLGNITIGAFPDGETSCKIDEDVRGRDVYLIQPTCPPANEHLMQLLVMIDSCKRASAERVTAVMPYFGYARQDRKDEGRVPSRPSSWQTSSRGLGPIGYWRWTCTPHRFKVSSTCRWTISTPPQCSTNTFSSMNLPRRNW